MTITTANCPSCGGPITFKLGSSIVVICEYCNSAVARTDRDVRNLGKVADIIDTRSPLEIGTEGRLDGKPFVLTGRAQIGHEAGGVWDEWYATFGDGRTGWLAEAQGRFYMTFPVRVQDPGLLPPLHGLRPGAAGSLPGATNRFVVTEIGEGRQVAAKGEIPYELVPGEQYYYADFSGDNDAFATIDYSQTPPLVFTGKEVTLAEIGIFGEADEFSAEQRKVGAARLTCPQCNGPMELRAPESERVTCPNCNALLDVDRGNLSYLRTLAPGPRPFIPLGAHGTFEGNEFTVVGYMQRRCVVDGTNYWWEEYLLYKPEVGFRWLVQDSGHWSFVKPLAAGDVFDGRSSVSYHGRQFKEFQAVNAIVEQVLGEFYWRVEVGEMTRAADFIDPPLIISKEGSPSEVNWSLGTYITGDEISEIFKKTPPQPSARVGMAQPNPHKGKLRPWFVLLGIAFVLGIAFQVAGPRREVFKQTFTFQPLESATATQVVFTDPVELTSWKNIEVQARSPVDNTWAYIEGDFVNEDTGVVQNFSVPIEYYHGVDGGESWSEGSQDYDTHLSALPAGKYTLRLEAQWEQWQKPTTVSVTVLQGDPRFAHWLVLLGVLAVPTLIVSYVRFAFERTRWSESMFNPYQSADE